MRISRWATAATAVVLAACSDREQILEPGTPIDVAGPKFGAVSGSGIAVDTGGAPTGASNLGGVRFRSFNASGADPDVFLGASSIGSGGQRGSKTFSAGALVDLVQDGDCSGDWDIGASTSARASNEFSLTWDIAKDSLSTKVKNSQLDCTLAYRNFSAGVAVKRFSRFTGDATGDRAVAKAALRNLTYLQVQRNGNGSGQTVTPIVVSSLRLDNQYDVGNTAITSTGVEVTSGAFVTGRVTGYDFDAGGGFTVSGKLEVGPQAACGSAEGCRAEFTFGSPTRRLTLDTAAAAVGSPVLAVVPNPVGSTPTASASAVTAANLPTAFRPFVLTGSNFFTLTATNADPANDLGYMVCVNGSSSQELYYFNGTAWEKITSADLSSTGRRCGYANSTSLSAALFAVAAPKGETSIALTCQAATYTGAALTPCSGVVNDVGGSAITGATADVTYTDNTNAGMLSGTAEATFAGNDDYLPAPKATVKFTIAKAATNTTVTCTSPQTYSGSALTPCSVITTWAGGTLTAPTIEYTDNTNAGTGTARATYGETTNFMASGDEKTFVIEQADASISISNMPTAAYVDGSFTATFTKTGDGAASVESSTPGVCTVSGNTVTFISVGLCSLNAETAETNNFKAKTGATQAVTVTVAIPSTMSNFFPPIAAGTNSVNAGRTIPIKFRLGPNPPSGVNITAETRACGASTWTPATLTSAGWQLQTDGTWQANWDTPKSFSGCRELRVTPNAAGYAFSPTSRTATFIFR